MKNKVKILVTIVTKEPVKAKIKDELFSNTLKNKEMLNLAIKYFDKGIFYSAYHEVINE